MFRQSKKIICMMIALFFVVGCVFSTSFTSHAMNSVTVPWNQPQVTDTSGYITIVYRTYAGNVYADTYQWCLTPTWLSDVYVDEGNPTPNGQVTITVNSNSLYFKAEAEAEFEGYFTLWSYDGSSGKVTVRRNYHLDGSDINDYYCTSNLNYGSATIIGYEFSGGNISNIVNNISSFSNYSIVYGSDAALYNEMTNLLSAITSLNASLGGKLDSMINEMITLLAEVDDVEEGIQYLKDYIGWILQTLDRIEVYEKESNSWLEKIFNYLSESEERQKETATTQGNTSISQGNGAIEDKGAGFTSSLGGLTSSMSYSGTQCAWEFPEVKLPAIAGVMDEIVLIKKQPIDFAVWVNAIPSDILIVVQSLCTIGLIVFCFKELYGTIEYVLTLRKGGGSDE